MMELLCPCGTGKTYNNCCKIFHDGDHPSNGLLLMRSRYCAYVYHMAEYIIRTTHPKNPHYKHNHPQWILEILYFSQNTKFQKLDILEFIEGINESYVTFVVSLIQNNVKKKLMEKSHFEKVQEQWLYRNCIHLNA